MLHALLDPCLFLRSSPRIEDEVALSPLFRERMCTKIKIYMNNKKIQTFTNSLLIIEEFGVDGYRLKNINIIIETDWNGLPMVLPWMGNWNCFLPKDKGRPYSVRAKENHVTETWKYSKES